MNDTERLAAVVAELNTLRSITSREIAQVADAPKSSAAAFTHADLDRLEQRTLKTELAHIDGLLRIAGGS